MVATDVSEIATWFLYAFKRLSRHNKIEYCTRMQNSYADDNVSYFGILIYLGNADWVIMQGTTKL